MRNKLFAANSNGLFVVVLGSDGTIKRMLIQNLQRELRGTFKDIVYFHFMPRLLRRGGGGQPVTNPHAKPPRSCFLSILKLIYYWLDFNLGYLFKVRPALKKSALVLFDRYFDDLLIDPKRYRYGGPMALARLLQRFIPRPDLFFVLDTPIEKILERKQEVGYEDLLCQREAFCDFAVQTPNAYLLDGDLPADEVAREAHDLTLEYLQAHQIVHGQIYSTSTSDETLVWLSNAIHVRVTKRGSTHAYLNLPDGRGYLFPLDNGRVFQRGLDLYPAQVRIARLSKTLIRIMAKWGFKGYRFPHLQIETKESWVFQAIRDWFERNDLCFAISTGTPGLHRKPVIQVTTHEGEILGYAKVGWSEITTDLVMHEAEILKCLNDKNSIPFEVPKLLFIQKNNEECLCIQSPPLEGSRPAPRRLDRDYIKVLSSLACIGFHWHSLENTAFWQRIVTRVEKIQSSYWHRVLTIAIDHACQSWQGREIPLHLAHGDFTPWNALRINGHLYLYDWEDSIDEAPAGYDLYHFLIQTLWLVERQTSETIYRNIFHRIHEPWSEIYGKHVERRIVLALFELYLIDRLTFYSNDSIPVNTKVRQLLWEILQRMNNQRWDP